MKTFYFLLLYSTECVWKSQDCILSVHVDSGFILADRLGREIWQQPYQNLCSSNDDGAKLLWLQFRGSQEEEEFVLQVRFCTLQLAKRLVCLCIE